jgi:hypothetical protein
MILSGCSSSTWQFWHISQGVCSEALIQNGRERLAHLSFNHECFCSLRLQRSQVSSAIFGFRSSMVWFMWTKPGWPGRNWCRTGHGREYTPPWFVQQEGQWFWKAVHILSRSTKLFTPAILRRGLVMTQYSYLERSTPVVAGNLDVNFSKCGVWPRGGQSPTAPLYLQVQVAHAYNFPWKLKRKPISLLAVVSQEITSPPAWRESHRAGTTSTDQYLKSSLVIL